MSTPHQHPPISADLIDRVTARVRSALGATRQTTPTSVTSYDSLHEAAAVLAWFDPATLRASVGGTDPAAVEELLVHSQPVVQADGTQQWTLSSGIRVATLRQLRERDRVQVALAANPVRPPGPLQEALEARLRGTGTPVEMQSLAELGASYQVCEWLRDAGFANIPDRDRIRRRIDWLTLLEPFEHIAGEHFQGRDRELAKLRRYVDVLPSPSWPEAVSRGVARNLLKNRPPLLIYGPGGVGKSALLARFILNHVQVNETDRFPFIYLDFDRPDVAASEPLTLLIEAVRQLGIEYPNAHDRCDQIRKAWLEQLAKSGPDTRRLRSAAVRDFGSLIESLGVSGRPVLFVLDTFEEVQWRSDEYVTAIWRLIEDIQEIVERLRVCVSGRAQIPGRKPEELALTGLDEEASIGYLRACGVTDPAVARTLARQVRGNPLSLKLAAELFARKGLKDGGLDIDEREYLFKRVADGVIQRQLYQRILGHIHNKDVRRLAHPGLVLRRITPDLILHVLAGPCHLDIDSLAGARALFGELRREVSLVTVVSDEVLEHRRDLRRLMLELLESDEPRKVRAIRELAVAWYESRPAAPAERGEEIYHRLSLGQDPEVIDARWLPGVEPYLMPALPEFQGARLAYLALRLNLEVNEETRRLAELEDWERIVERKARDLLTEGQPEEALSLLRSREERTGASPLFGVEATVLARLGRWAESSAVLDRGLESALAATARQQILGLTLREAELVLAWISAGSAEEVPRHRPSRRLEELNDGSLALADRLTVLTHRLALGRELGEPAAKLAGLAAECRRAFDDAPDEALSEDPVAGRWAASVFRDGQDASRLARVLQVCGWPFADESALRQAGASIAQFDLRLSTERGEPPGALAREFGIPERDSLTAAWSDFLLTVSDEMACAVLVRLLEENADVVPTELVAAFAIVMQSALGVWTRAPEAAEAVTTQRPARSRVPPQLREELATALATMFPSNDALRRLLRQGLDRSLEAIAPGGSDPQSLARAIVEAAYTQGWLEVLVAKAMERYPTSSLLPLVAEQLGLSSLVSGDPGADGRAERLATIERQVCRIERGGYLLGTAFLIGADLVLTADHVLSSLWHGSVSPSEITFRFDLTTGSRKEIVTEGTLFRLGDVVQRNAELDYALLRVGGSPGVQPIGGGPGPGGALRHWIDVSHAPRIHQGDQLLMVGYARERPPALTIDRGAVAALRDDSVIYAIRSEPGFSGAPCFTRDLELVALNTRRADDPAAPRTASAGVLMSAVTGDLGAQGFGDFLYRPFV